MTPVDCPPTMNAAPLPNLAALGANPGRMIARHIERVFRAVLRGDRVTAASGSIRLVTGAPHPFGNLAIIADVTDRSAVQAAIRDITLADAPSAALWVDPVPAELAVELKRAGFQPGGPMPLMGIECDQLAPAAVPAGTELVRVGSGAEGKVWEDVFAAGYGLPPVVAAYFAPNRVGAGTGDTENLQFFLVKCGGQSVATSMLYLAEGVAGVYCVATLPEHRKRGFGAFATAEALRRSRHLGYRVGILQASEPGHPVYRRLGFREFGDLPIFIRMPGGRG
jgi:GNAT superfamily N-acetyltransferase